jgi:Flp pilus assembly protein TadG
MKYVSPTCRDSSRRRGKILVLFVLLLPALLGMLGLVIEGGTLMATHRQVQTAADAAALAAAFDKLRGKTDTAATATATTFVQTHNGLSSATVTVNIPPTSGSYSGNSQYVEVIVSYNVTTTIMPVLGLGSTQNIQARAVAGYEAVAAGEGVGVLDPTENNGLSVSGTGSSLVVNGRIIVNAKGASTGQKAVAVSPTHGIKSKILDVVGTVDNPDNVDNYDTGTPTPTPITTGQTPEPDPLINLPTPTTSNGVTLQYPSYDSTTGTWSYLSAPTGLNIGSGETVTVPPGIYSSIRVTGGTVTFSSGIFVIAGGGLTLTGGTITGSGVMFYNTGPLVSTTTNAIYNPVTGGADANDYTTYNPVPGTSDPTEPPSSGGFQNNFGGITMQPGTGNSFNFSALTSGTFKGVLLYQRRANTQSAVVASANSNLTVSGTIYAQWARFTVTGGGTYNAQFIVGSIQVSGGATLTINYAGQNTGRANQVFLVE